MRAWFHKVAACLRELIGADAYERYLQHHQQHLQSCRSQVMTSNIKEFHKALCKFGVKRHWREGTEKKAKQIALLGSKKLTFEQVEKVVSKLLVSLNKLENPSIADEEHYLLLARYKLELLEGTVQQG